MAAVNGERTELAIIGGGPAGLIAAREAAKEGVEVTVLEEHKSIGRPCHCAGLLSIKGLKALQIPIDNRFVQNMVRGAIFFSPSKLSFKVERRDPVACIVNRVEFDRFLAERAVQAGVNIKLNAEVYDVEMSSRGVTLTGNFGKMEAELVIDAEGVKSHIIRMAGLETVDPGGLLPAIQYELLTDAELDMDHVEIHISRKIAPSFFAWIMPLTRHHVRVGLACKGNNIKDRLEKFIEGNICLANRSAKRKYSGLVVTCGPIPKTYHDRFMAVGDVAGQVKPTTGGGIIWGGLCAVVAGKTAAEAIKTGRVSEEILRRYEILWKEKLGREMKAALLARKIANRLSDKTVDKIFKKIIETEFYRDITDEGDIDFQRKIIVKAIRKLNIPAIILSSINNLIIDRLL